MATPQVISEKTGTEIAKTLKAITGSLNILDMIHKTPSIGGPKSPIPVKKNGNKKNIKEENKLKEREAERIAKEHLSAWKKKTDENVKLFATFSRTEFGRSIIRFYGYIKGNSVKFFQSIQGIASGMFNRIFGDLLGQLGPIVDLFKAFATLTKDFIVTPLMSLPGLVAKGLIKATKTIIGTTWSIIKYIWRSKTAKLHLKETKKHTSILRRLHTYIYTVKKKEELENTKTTIIRVMKSIWGVTNVIGSSILSVIKFFVPEILLSAATSLIPLMVGFFAYSAIKGWWKEFKLTEEGQWIDKELIKPIVNFWDKTVRPMIESAWDNHVEPVLRKVCKEVGGAIWNGLKDLILGGTEDKDKATELFAQSDNKLKEAKKLRDNPNATESDLQKSMELAKEATKLAEDAERHEMSSSKQRIFTGALVSTGIFIGGTAGWAIGKLFGSSVRGAAKGAAVGAGIGSIIGHYTAPIIYSADAVEVPSNGIPLFKQGGIVPSKSGFGYTAVGGDPTGDSIFWGLPEGSMVWPNKPVDQKRVLAEMGLSNVMKYIQGTSHVKWDSSNANWLIPSFKGNIENFAKDYYEKTGEYLKVTESFRTHQDQVNMAMKNPAMAAAPGRSMHEYGHAVDLNPEQIRKYESIVGKKSGQDVLEKFGLHRPMWPAGKSNKTEEWHVEPIETKGNWNKIMNEGMAKGYGSDYPGGNPMTSSFAGIGGSAMGSQLKSLLGNMWDISKMVLSIALDVGKEIFTEMMGVSPEEMMGVEELAGNKSGSGNGEKVQIAEKEDSKEKANLEEIAEKTLKPFRKSFGLIDTTMIPDSSSDSSSINTDSVDIVGSKTRIETEYCGEPT